MVGLVTLVAISSLIEGCLASSLTQCFCGECLQASNTSLKYRFNCNQLRFTTVPDTETPFKNKTVKISMKQNKISTIENEAFMGMIMLEEIELDNNVIESIRPDAFFSVQRLKTLSLSNNRLQYVPSQALWRTPDLSDLDLSHNKITVISNGDFQYLNHLQRLELSGNEISLVEPLAFKNLLELAYLSLAGNQIQTFQRAMEKSMPLHSLKTFQVYDNPWYCDCALRWVFNYTVKQGFQAVSSCNGPQHLKAKPWSKLYPSDFACAPHVRLASGDESAQMGQIENGTLHVAKGSAALLSCVVYSDPIGFSSWYRNGERISERDSRIVVSVGRPMLGSLKMNSTYFSEVKLAETNENDSAVYSCEVLNSAGSAWANVTLTIVESASENQPLNTLQKSLARMREATALHYALIACCAIACVVTLISVVACAFYCTKRFLLIRYSSRCRAYQPAKQLDATANANANATVSVKANGNTANMILNSNSEDLSTYRSCNFVDNYNCFDTHLNMLSEADNRCEYANIVQSNDGAGYFADIHHQNLPLKGAMVILKPDGTACHHVLHQDDLNQQPACPCEQTPSRAHNQNASETLRSRNDSHAFGHSELPTPLGNTPDPINPYSDSGSATIRSITFKPAINSQLSGSSFNTLTLLKSSRRHNANTNGAFYAPIASYEDDQIGHGNNHRRTASTSTFTNVPSRLAKSDQASLV